MKLWGFHLENPVIFAISGISGTYAQKAKILFGPLSQIYPSQFLEKHLMVHVNNYFKEVIQASNKVTPYITQSWVNFTALDENHHFHSHSNSIASGVLYIAADKKHDLITFHKMTFFFLNF